jgi:DNA replication factor GINS
LDFQRLREIQKKERNISGLANVGDNFYKDVYNYLDRLMLKIGNNPFSLDSYLLRDARRIAAEICERREHKITNSAILNVQRTNGLFNDNSEKNGLSVPTAPPENLTPEEENLYYSITKSLIKYRNEMIPQLKSLKNKGNKVTTTEKQQKSSLPLHKEKNRNNEKKSLPLGIEHDIASFQAYEQPESIIKNAKSSKKDIPSINKDKKDQMKTVMALEELPSIMGVDNKIYGPLSPQDIITMPEQTAMILITNNKGRFIEKYKKIAYR